MKIMEMKHGKEWRENKEEIKAWGERSFIAGHGLIVYTMEHFALLSPRRYGQLVETRTREVTTRELQQKFKDVIKEYLPQDKVEELIKKLSR
jgi:hypothetical protein